MTDSCGHTTTVALVCQVPEGGTEDRAIARGQTGSTQLGRVLLVCGVGTLVLFDVATSGYQ